MKKLELKIPPPFVMLIFAGLMKLTADSFSGLNFDFAGRQLLGALMLAVGLSIDIYAILGFLKTKTTVNPIRPETASALVTTGMYQFSRNPMYLGLLCLLTAWILWLANFAAAVFLPLFVLYIERFQIIPEEQILNRIFQEEYGNYCQRVRRWI